MDFSEYRSKVVAYAKHFFSFANKDDWRGSREKFFAHMDSCEVELDAIRNAYTRLPPFKPYQPSEGLEGLPLLGGNKVLQNFYKNNPAELYKSLRDIDFNSDLETLTKQAEAVKNEIIECYKIYHSMHEDDFPSFVDFIRDPTGKIVYPFDFWSDCWEVYRRKYLLNHSNYNIARSYHFKSSKAGTDRQRDDLVAKMLVETEKLIQSVLQKRFPPKILKGGKQPTMINE